MPRMTETRAQRAPLPTDKAVVFERCSEVKGFGVAIHKTGVKTWIAEFRQDGRVRRVAIGRVGVLPCESTPKQKGARDLAISALNSARFGGDGRAAISRDKKPKGLTIGEIWQAYEQAGYPMVRGTGRKQASTAYADKQRWAKYITPSLGKKPVSEVDTAAVQRWLDRDVPTKGQRNACLILLKSILSYARSRKLATVNDIDIKAGKSREMQQFYGTDELIALDQAAAAIAAENPGRIGPMSAVRLLLHTGARASEILRAEWNQIDARRGVLKLERDKASQNGREIHLSDAAISIIAALPQLNSSPFLFPVPEARDGHLTTLQKAWADTVKRAGVRRYRLHDLRHSFASAAIADGVSLFVTGKLLGHRQATTTARYAHLESQTARAALDRVANRLTPVDKRAG